MTSTPTEAEDQAFSSPPPSISVSTRSNSSLDTYSPSLSSSSRSYSPSPSHTPSLQRDNSFSQHSKRITTLLQRSLSFEPLLKRKSTFWPTREEVIARHPNINDEFLNPVYDSTLRKTDPLSAIFNLVATVCGGGVLTLPIAFARAGIIPSTIMMIVSAIATDFSMYILCSCARRTGTNSYGDVTRVAFGTTAEIGVTVLLFVFLLFVIVAYFILVKDIWTPVLMFIFPKLKEWSDEMLVEYFDGAFTKETASAFGFSNSNSNADYNSYGVNTTNNAYDPDESNIPSFIFLVIFIIISFPLLLKRDLYALRHTCYVGFTSLILLIVAIVRRSYEVNCVDQVGIFGRKVKWMTDDINDVIYAFPIIALSFFSIYNVLSVHSALIRPTRERVKFVVDGTILICLVLFYIVGLCGYLYSYDQTLDNILLNFPLEFKDVLIGRIGYGFTLMFGLPLVFLPAREALLRIPVLIYRWWCSNGDEYGNGEDCSVRPGLPVRLSPCLYTSSPSQSIRKSGVTKDGHMIVNGIDFDEERPLLLRRNADVIPLEKLVGADGRILLPPMSSVGAVTGKATVPVASTTTTFGYGSTTPVPVMTKSTSNDDDTNNDTIEEDGGEGSITTSDNTVVCKAPIIEKAPSAEKATSTATVTPSSLTSYQDSASMILKRVSNMSNTSTGTMDRSQMTFEELLEEAPVAIHVLSTISILAVAFFCAVALPGVGVVWSICGSSMSIVIGFFVPAACYLKIRTKKGLNNPRTIASLFMVFFSIISSVVCTSHVIADVRLNQSK
uniref:Amino acid transporter transmembrane domain-containing protein n=1 Tax=Chaetoceros debilis TaxID=122233 RepID=A0A7S3Q1N8_9STRA